MSYETGAVRYLFGMLITVPGFIALYIFGGKIMSGLRAFGAALQVIFSDESFIETFTMTFVELLIAEYLPPTSISQVIAQAVIGGIVAAGLWYIAVPKQGR